MFWNEILHYLICLNQSLIRRGTKVLKANDLRFCKKIYSDWNYVQILCCLEFPIEAQHKMWIEAKSRLFKNV